MPVFLTHDINNIVGLPFNLVLTFLTYCRLLFSS